MRIYHRDEVCPFRFTQAAWGEFSNFAPLTAPIAGAPTAREAAAIGRGERTGVDPRWYEQRVNVMRWVLRMKREANAASIDAALAASGERAIVEVSTRDPWWGARPDGDRYRGANVLGRLWMELRQQLRDGDPAARAAAWAGRIRVGPLADAPHA